MVRTGNFVSRIFKLEQAEKKDDISDMENRCNGLSKEQIDEL
jgi:hypothetical protein